jgi:hypothetical protein
MELLGVKEVGETLGWDRRKISVYLQRKKLPEPVARLAAGPVWRQRDIEVFPGGGSCQRQCKRCYPARGVHTSASVGSLRSGPGRGTAATELW